MRFFNKQKMVSNNHRSKEQITFALIALTLGMSGCSTSETFDCEPGKGVGCRSITKVNRMIDGGYFRDTFGDTGDEFFSPLPKPLVSSFSFPPYSASPSSPSLSSASPSPQAFSPSPDPTQVVLSDHTVVQRMAEHPIRVWVAPYQDEAGNFHEASVVHSVIQGGYWRVQPLDAKT